MAKPCDWYRIQFNDVGHVLSVVKVESQRRGSDHIFYIRARSESQAKAEAYRLGQRLLQNRRRAEYKKAGMCRCGRPRDDGKFRRCSKCRERGSADRKRQLARDKGLPVETPPKRDAFREREAEKRAVIELELLLKVREAFNRPRRGQARALSFGEWLDTMIEARKSRGVKAA